MTPDQLLATMAGLTHDGQAPDLLATVATTCPDCGEDYDEVGATSRCRIRHDLRLTPGQRELYYRGMRADGPARASLTRARRAGKAGNVDRARALLEEIPPHRWELAMVNRLHAASCPSCAEVLLVGDEDDRIAARVRADPWRLTTAGEVAAIVLGRPTWRLWGAWPSYRAQDRQIRLQGVVGPSAAVCTVVAAHVCGTRLDGEPVQAAIAHTRSNDEIPF